jgi:hypothetical protein
VTATEYGLHRFLMHEPRRGLASVEHLKHHADVTYFSPTSKKLASAAPHCSGYPRPPRWRAGVNTAFTAGLLSMYFAMRSLTGAPTLRPEPLRTLARRNHLHHHFGAPMRNFGVTSPRWDKVFGT